MNNYKSYAIITKDESIALTRYSEVLIPARNRYIDGLYSKLHMADLLNEHLSKIGISYSSDYLLVRFPANNLVDGIITLSLFEIDAIYCLDQQALDFYQTTIRGGYHYTLINLSIDINAAFKKYNSGKIASIATDAFHITQEEQVEFEVIFNSPLTQALLKFKRECRIPHNDFSFLNDVVTVVLITEPNITGNDTKWGERISSYKSRVNIAEYSKLLEMLKNDANETNDFFSIMQRIEEYFRASNSIVVALENHLKSISGDVASENFSLIIFCFIYFKAKSIFRQFEDNQPEKILPQLLSWFNEIPSKSERMPETKAAFFCLIKGLGWSVLADSFYQWKKLPTYTAPSDYESLGERAIELEQQLTDSQQEVQSFKAQLDSSQTHAEELQRQLTDSQSKAKGYKDQLGASQVQAEELKQQLTNSQQEVQCFKDQLNSSHTHAEELQRQLTDSQSKAKCYKDQLGASQVQAEELKQQLTNSQQEVQCFKDQLNSSHTHAEELQRQLTDSQSKAKCYKDQLGASQVQAEELKQQLTNSQQEVQCFRDQLNSSHTHAEELQRQLTDSQSKAKGYKDQLGASQVQAEELKQQLTNSQQEVQCFRDQLNSSHTHAEELQRQLTDSQSKAKGYKDQLGASQVQAEELRQQLTNSQQEVQCFKDQLNSSQTHAEELQRQLTDSQKQSYGFKEQLIASQSEVQRFKDQLAAGQEKIQVPDCKLVNSQSKTARLVNSLQENSSDPEQLKLEKKKALQFSTSITSTQINKLKKLELLDLCQEWGISADSKLKIDVLKKILIEKLNESQAHKHIDKAVIDSDLFEVD